MSRKVRKAEWERLAPEEHCRGLYDRGCHPLSEHNYHQTCLGGSSIPKVLLCHFVNKPSKVR